MESILTSVKEYIGPSADYDVFDPILITHINSVFMVLHQLGVGPENGFYINDSTAYWKDYLVDETVLPIVRTYMGAKVRLAFDPPSNSTLLNALNQVISECEARLNFAVDR